MRWGAGGGAADGAAGGGGAGGGVVAAGFCWAGVPPWCPSATVPAGRGVDVGAAERAGEGTGGDGDGADDAAVTADNAVGILAGGVPTEELALVATFTLASTPRSCASVRRERTSATVV